MRNHFQHNSWGTEERYGGCPIGGNQPFEIMILAEENHFKITVNGSHFCFFKHRLPLNVGQYISVKGGCSIQSITVEHLQSNTLHNNNHMGFVLPSYPVL